MPQATTYKFLSRVTLIILTVMVTGYIQQVSDNSPVGYHLTRRKEAYLGAEVLRIPIKDYKRQRETMEWIIHKPTYRDIELRAYELWLKRGGTPEENWLQAEKELAVKATVYIIDVVPNQVDPYEETIQTIIRGDIPYYWPHLRAYLSTLHRKSL